MHIYSNPERQNDTHSLPDVEVFQLNAVEVAELDEDLVLEYLRKQEYRLATVNGRARDAMLDAIVEDHSITGGWFYQFCFPGCLPESQPFGPYATASEAVAAAQEQAA